MGAKESTVAKVQGNREAKSHHPREVTKNTGQQSKLNIEEGTNESADSATHYSKATGFCSGCFRQGQAGYAEGTTCTLVSLQRFLAGSCSFDSGNTQWKIGTRRIGTRQEQHARREKSLLVHF